MRFSFSAIAGSLMILTALGANKISAADPQGQIAAYYEPAIDTLAKDLERDYVFADMGQKYAAMLRRNLQGGIYRGVTDPAEISKRLTEDLNNVSQDLHLHVRPVPATTTAMSAPAAPKPAVEGGAWLADGVAYIRFNRFPGTPKSVTATEEFMRDHVTAKAIIIDSRHNHGGGADEMNAMLPYLFGKRTKLMDMELARDVAQEQGFSEDNFFHRVDAPPGRYASNKLWNPAPPNTACPRPKSIT
jgi:hypothetical protein